MGAEPCWYRVKYQEDIEAALQALREREFKAGRYRPVIPFLQFPIGSDAASPGAQHSTIDEARAEVMEEGTGSILDFDHISEEPDYCALAPMDAETHEALYGTAKPTAEMVTNNMAFLEDVERGQGVYITLYKDDQPDEILFAGFSFD